MMPVTESSPDESTPVQPDMVENQQTNVLVGSPSDPTTIPIGGIDQVFYQQTNATLALVLAILSWTCGSLLFSIPALIIASKAREITDSITFHPDASTAKVAYIAALVNVIVTSVLTLVWVLFMAYMILIY